LARRAAATGRGLDALRVHGAAGTPEQVAEALAKYIEAGATRLYLQILDLRDLGHIAELGAALMPLLSN
jgi:alkanesulfonate monooxygenase SsuD/methylene tetrahydromethanopterin reductase-like flavin-dependent oxidoreductase (luciferase family)